MFDLHLARGELSPHSRSVSASISGTNTPSNVCHAARPDSCIRRKRGGTCGVAGQDHQVTARVPEPLDATGCQFVNIIRIAHPVRAHAHYPQGKQTAHPAGALPRQNGEPPEATVENANCHDVPAPPGGTPLFEFEPDRPDQSALASSYVLRRRKCHERFRIAPCTYPVHRGQSARPPRRPPRYRPASELLEQKAHPQGVMQVAGNLEQAAGVPIKEDRHNRGVRFRHHPRGEPAPTGIKRLCEGLGRRADRAAGEIPMAPPCPDSPSDVLRVSGSLHRLFGLIETDRQNDLVESSALRNT